MGTLWYAGFDNGGTTQLNLDFNQDEGNGNRYALVQGHLATQASPWPWANLCLPLGGGKNGSDLSPFKSIAFRAKGDGKGYVLSALKTVVKDYANFQYTFNPTSAWKQYEIPLSQLKQPSWGKKQLVFS